MLRTLTIVVHFRSWNNQNFSFEKYSSVIHFKGINIFYPNNKKSIIVCSHLCQDIVRVYGSRHTLCTEIVNMFITSHFYLYHAFLLLSYCLKISNNIHRILGHFKTVT
jgi:hypothetical protein